jgi:hypothetical protein
VCICQSRTFVNYIFGQYKISSPSHSISDFFYLLSFSFYITTYLKAGIKQEVSQRKQQLPLHFEQTEKVRWYLCEPTTSVVKFVKTICRLFNEGNSPFKSAASRVPQEGSSERVLSMRTPPGGSKRDEISPSPHREGQPLIASNPPSRAVSRTGEPM